jgi:hypothetical protein
MDQSKALRVAAEAFDLWQAERLSEAEQRYRDALAEADPGHYLHQTSMGSTRPF